MYSFYLIMAVFVRRMIFVLFFLMVATLSAQFAGGDGTEESPWQIATAAHLNNVRDFLGQQHSDKFFIQTSDIDLGTAPWNEDEGWEPIGFHIAWNNFGYFQGSYNGNGFAIENLTINRNGDYQGLFGYIDQGTVSNVALDSVSVTGRQYVGAIAGRNSGAIINSYATGSVVGVTNSNYVGGLVGYNYFGQMHNNWVNIDVVAEGPNVGGLVGQNTVVSTISNSYAAGRVTGNVNVGGLVGHNRSTIVNSYATGAVSGNEAVGGLVGFQFQSTVTNSYWNTETTDREQSAGGEARTTAQMVLSETFTDWDFQDIWQMEEGITYPYLQHQEEPLEHNYPYGRISSHPLPGCSPIPSNDTTGVSINLQEVSWAYQPDVLYTNPCGFRVYMNETGEFGEDDDYEWVAYDAQDIRFSCSTILPEQLDYLTRYYWLVIPSAIDPDQEISYDAEGCSVWSFTTEINPNPAPAVNPVPADDSTGFTVKLDSLSWDYIVDTLHVNPAGFRVYFDTEGEFGEHDDYDWVPYNDGRVNYSSSRFLSEGLKYGTKYYWMVIPTTIEPERRGSDRETERREWSRERGALSREQRAEGRSRGDAENCPLWSFTTKEPYPNPLPAKNPSPADEALDIPVILDTLSWYYLPEPAFANPSGFRVYLNKSGEFDVDDEYDWIPYEEEAERYFSSALLVDDLEYNTKYYWQVIPTTIKPERRGSDGERDRREWSVEQREEGRSKGDAEDCPVWTFTTEVDTHVEVAAGIRKTRLHRNYPNPFNPETTISFYLFEPAKVSLDIFNIRGQVIISIIDNEYLREGDYSYYWDGRDKFEQQIGGGVYFYRLESRSDSGEIYSFVNKMIKLK